MRRAYTEFNERLGRATYDAAAQVTIWGTPIVSVDAMRQAFFRDAHAQYNVVFWSKPADWGLQIATPNASSHYAYLNFNTKEGPIVMEIPNAVDAGFFGSILDVWQVPLADIGPEGEDQGKAGLFCFAFMDRSSRFSNKSWKPADIIQAK